MTSTTMSSIQQGEAWLNNSTSGAMQEIDELFDSIVRPMSVSGCFHIGAVNVICKRMEEVLQIGRSADFNGRGLSESGLKMILFGLLASQDNHEWEILSEEEIESSGFADVVLKHTGGQEATVIELKYVRAEYLRLHLNNSALSSSQRKNLEKTLKDLDQMSISELKSQTSRTWERGFRSIQHQIKDAVAQCQRYAKGWKQCDKVRSVVLLGVGRRVLGVTWKENEKLPEDATDWEKKVNALNLSLWLGLENNDRDLVTKSLEAGATLDSRKGRYFSPLHFTITHDYEEMASLLVEKGANVWLKDKNGINPVEIALAQGKISLFHLLSSTQDIKINDPQVSCWPLDWAKMKEAEDTLRTDYVKAGKIIRTGETLLKPILNMQLRKTKHNIPTIFPSKDPLAFEEQCIVDKNTFDIHWNILTDGLFGPDFPWSNVFCAGGAVLACCLPLNDQDREDPRTYFKEKSPFRGGDVDLFIHGLSPDRATQKSREIMAYFQRHGKCEPLFVRSKNCITIIVSEGKKQVQIILRCYQNPVQVLMGFDLDCCCVGFDGFKVVAIPRAIRAFKYRINLVDATRQSMSYSFRLEKYAKRGFSVGVPGLERDKINPKIYSQSYKELQGLAKLLVLESGKKVERERMASDYQTYVVIPKTGSPGSISANLTEQVDQLSTGASFIHSFQIEEILTIPDDYDVSEGLEKKLENSWLVENPGRQFTGSFHPTKENFWAGAVK